MNRGTLAGSVGRREGKRKCLLPSGSRSPPGQTLDCPVTHPSADRQLTIAGSSLIKPQTPALRSPLLSPLKVIQGETELDSVSSQAPRGTSGTSPPAQEEPGLAHSGRHRAWSAQGSCPPPQRLGRGPSGLAVTQLAAAHSPGKKPPATRLSPHAGLQHVRAIGSNPWLFLNLSLTISSPCR